MQGSKRLVGVAVLVLVAAAISAAALASPYYKLNNGQLDLDHCEDWVGDVWCKKPPYPHNLYCYYSLCDAVADGVVSCKRAQSPCEPH